MEASPEKSDIFELIQKLPSAKALFLGIARLLLTMILCIVVWRHGGLEKPVGMMVQNTSQWVADQMIDPVEIISLQPSPKNPKIRVRTKSMATVTIHASRQSHQNFALLLPVILLSAFTLKRFATTLPQMIVGILFMGVFAVILNVTQSYILFNSYLEHGTGTLNIMKERLVLLPVNYIILPAVALYLSGLTVSGCVRLFTAKPKKASAAIPPKKKKVRQAAQSKAGRNELCPCGSGKKFKRCCGKAAG